MTLGVLLLLAAAAQGDTGSFLIRDFRFATGETRPGCGSITTRSATRAATPPALSAMPS